MRQSHDHKWYGTTELFAALDITIGRASALHPHSILPSSISRDLVLDPEQTTDQRSKGASFRSAPELVDCIVTFIDTYNQAARV
jgi:hypothetical protein